MASINYKFYKLTILLKKQFKVALNFIYTTTQLLSHKYYILTLVNKLNQGFLLFHFQGKHERLKSP